MSADELRDWQRAARRRMRFERSAGMLAVAASAAVGVGSLAWADGVAPLAPALLAAGLGGAFAWLRRPLDADPGFAVAPHDDPDGLVRTVLALDLESPLAPRLLREARGRRMRFRSFDELHGLGVFALAALLVALWVRVESPLDEAAAERAAAGRGELSTGADGVAAPDAGDAGSGAEPAPADAAEPASSAVSTDPEDAGQDSSSGAGEERPSGASAEAGQPENWVPVPVRQPEPTLRVRAGRDFGAATPAIERYLRRKADHEP